MLRQSYYPKSFLLSLTGAVFLCLTWCGCTPKPKPPSYDSTWVVIKDKSLAALESHAKDDSKNINLKASIDGFRNLVKQFPKDANCHQNLLVALLLEQKKSLQSNDASEGERIRKQIEPIIDELKRLQPNETDPLVLESRYYREIGDNAKAKDILRLAVKKNASADVFFQLIEHLQSEEGNNNDREILSLLESAQKLAPNNLVLVADYLVSLAKNQDKRFLEHLELCRQLYRPFLTQPNSKIPSLLDSAQNSGSKSDWEAAYGNANRLRNLLLGEIAGKHDLHVLRRDEYLEYVKTDFDIATAPTTVPRSKTSIVFAKKEMNIPLTGPVSAVVTDDFDIDGLRDLVIHTAGKVEAWSFHNPESPTKILSHEFASDTQGILLFDIDRDFQRSRENIPPSPLPSALPPDAPKKSPDQFVDTDVDVVIYGKDGLFLFENVLDQANGNRSLSSRPLSEGMEDLRGIQHVTTIDFDHDSDLDLVVSSSSGVSLWSNRGNWTFANFTKYSTVPDPAQSVSSLLALDVDRNVLNDFLLGSPSDRGPTMLASNLHGRYVMRDVAWPSELKESCRWLDAIDVNRDACWDIIGTGPGGTTLVTMKSIQNKNWTPSHAQRLSKQPSLGLLVADFDNDSFSDALTWGSRGAEVFFGGTDNQLQSEKGVLEWNEPLERVITLDFDLDRDEDLVCLTDQGGLLWWTNDGGNKNEQLEVVLRADEDGKQNLRARCNMHGVGSLIEVKVDGTYQSKIVRQTRTIFGLGNKTQADVARVIWPNGVPNNIVSLSSRAIVFDQQNLLGSCPYLYAWNGERFEFCTDCLWAAPIGLQFGFGVTAPTREWEYLKIDGSNVKPRGDEYVLQITEELWEAAYFDSVQLLAIDHPSDVDVFTNEKVGPAEMAEFKIYTVRNRLAPISIRDQNGNDLSSLTSKRDQRFTRTWTENFNQGLTSTHWIEIDFNRPSQEIALENKPSDDIMLYLTGWLFPTCTSLNLAMEENPLRPRLKPPAIEVPDSEGNWVEVIPYAGFPGGKTKTIAIDLKGKFLCEDHRIRLVSNMELCWDEVFWTHGERKPDSHAFVMTPLPLVGAELHYRGFSELVPQPANAPKRYEYQNVTKEPIWPPMTGAFTRFGDVTDLIREPDDLQVVMGAGDEMTVRFSTLLQDLPAGWVRDFVIYNVGWDKDADLNTIHGQDVAPLPFRAMSQYPYEPDQQFPRTPRHLDFLRRYQTRFQDAPAFWNQIRDFP